MKGEQMKIPCELLFKVEGKAGETARAEAVSPYLFRGTDLKATDSDGGAITTIKSVWVRGVEGLIGLPTIAFGDNSLGGGISYGTLARGDLIVFLVEFHADGEWSAKLSGEAVR
jgi:hypothetical protein